MVAIREVGPRDGFQNEPEVIATDDKVRLVELLARTGVRRLEVTSFVRADVIPQLADGAEVLRRADIPDAVAVTVLIPNERGLDNALELRDHFQEVNLFLSASETHNRRNVNRSIEESLTGLERVVGRARGEGLRCEGVISVSFGCPYEGEVPEERVLGIARRLAAAGCEEVAFGDTTGHGQPAPGAGFFERAAGELDVRAHRSLPQHARAGAGQRGRRARGRRALLRVVVRRAGRLPGAARAPPATWPPRTWCRCSTRWGYDTGIDLAALVAARRRGPARARAPARQPRAHRRAGGLAERADDRHGRDRRADARTTWRRWPG